MKSEPLRKLKKSQYTAYRKPSLATCMYQPQLFGSCYLSVNSFQPLSTDILATQHSTQTYFCYMNALFNTIQNFSKSTILFSAVVKITCMYIKLLIKMNAIIKFRFFLSNSLFTCIARLFTTNSRLTDPVHNQ